MAYLSRYLLAPASATKRPQSACAGESARKGRQPGFMLSGNEDEKGNEKRALVHTQPPLPRLYLGHVDCGVAPDLATFGGPKVKIRFISRCDLIGSAAMNPKYLPIRASEEPFFGLIRAAMMRPQRGAFPMARRARHRYQKTSAGCPDHCVTVSGEHHHGGTQSVWIAGPQLQRL